MRQLKLLTLLLLVVASGIGVVLSRHDSRGDFNRLQQLEARRDDLNVQWGRLQLEQATWADANRVEQHAREKLGLVSKAPEQVVVVVR